MLRRLTMMLAVAAAATPAFGQEPLRETVVVTAAATPVALGSVTRAVTVITREEIAQLPVHTVADVLRLVASIDVRARGLRGVQTDFAVRGAHFGQMLMLLDGVRLNDAQSGHHNGDIPVPLETVERIEVLHGPGSSLFGADAFGGTVNVITRRDAAPPSVRMEGGSFGLLAARARAGVGRGRLRQTLAVSADRSDGFMFERGFRTAAFSSRTTVGASSVAVSHVWKDFGANGFYGNAPSHEWTNQTLVAADHRLALRGGWRMSAGASYRTHGDRFLFDVRRPGVAENRHRTHAAAGTVTLSRGARDRGSISVGFEAGADAIRSTNLGDHTTHRASAFGEWRYAASARAQVDASLRVDRYSEFGTAWNPALGIAWWPGPGARVRASAGRAFRVPTFTERYYQDPAHRARPEVQPETAWAGEAGLDVFLGNRTLLSATIFGRVEEEVIDWLRPTPADRWRTYNIRDVDSAGLELAFRAALRGGAFIHAGYTAVDVRAAAVSQLSKYVLDYAPHTVVAAVAVPLPAGLRLAPRLEYKHRTRSTGEADYALLDARLSRRFGAVEVFIEGTNLLNHAYEEVASVPMPGRALSVSVALTP